MQRLGKNFGGYQGETISIDPVLRGIEEACLRHGWHCDCFSGDLSLCGYRRSTARPRGRVYISTGIHGDEPAGPLAVLDLVRANAWPEEIDLWLCPCLNPTGFQLNRRENALGIDLNRDYRHLSTEEVRAHVRWLQDQPPFDLSVILHEDWEANGFYVYELNPTGRPSLAERIIEAVSAVCPIETGSVVDGWPAEHGIIRPDVPLNERPRWAESLYLISEKTALSYTLEAPSDYPLEVRVRALKVAVRAALESLIANTCCGETAG